MSPIEQTAIPKRPPTEHKAQQVDAMRDLLQRSEGVILTDYRGLSVSEKADLSRRLREAGAEYHVVKNTLFKIAYQEEGEVTELLAGPTAVAYIMGDAAAAAKALSEFIRAAKKVTIKGGVVQGAFYTTEQIAQLAALPPRDVLIAEILGSIQAPAAGIVGALDNVLGQLVWTLHAIAEQQEQQAAA